jgi:ribonucleoside-triphosphate reductase
MNGELSFSEIIKRNGEKVDFNPEKIEHAIFKAMRAIGHPDRKKQMNFAIKYWRN